MSRMWYHSLLSKEAVIIRKVQLSMNEQKKYEIIKSLADHDNQNKQRAALILGCTVQSRLPIELRLAGIATIDDANEFLNRCIKEFNEKFSLPLNGIRSVFAEQPSNEKINLILAVLCERVVDSGHCLQHSKKYIPPMSHPWRRQSFEKFVKQQEHHRRDAEEQNA